MTISAGTKFAWRLKIVSRKVRRSSVGAITGSVSRQKTYSGFAFSTSESSYSSGGMLMRVASSTMKPSPMTKRLMMITAAWAAFGSVSHSCGLRPIQPRKMLIGP